jgi:outer membrane protein OmpA-like peptidoglycan-associated protein
MYSSKKGLVTAFLICTFSILPLACSAQLYALTSSDFYIFFDSDSYEVSPEQQKRLTDKILQIGGTNIKEIYVEGHTDTFATAQYNQVLSANRAQATAMVLEHIGVPQRFIKMESFGESQIISPDQKENRRAKVYFVYETDHRSTLNPPKFIVIKTIDKKTKKPINASIGFSYTGQDMRFSTTGTSGISATFAMLGTELQISATAVNYLSAYYTVPLADVDKPKDTLVYTLELVKVKITGSFTFNNIYFFTDSDEIRPESSPELLKVLAILQHNTDAFIEIQGHMNYPLDRPMNSIQSQYNKELSFKRAKAINDYLVKNGIEQQRLTYVGMSNTRMKFKFPSNTAQEDQNKRVEVYTLKGM